MSRISRDYMIEFAGGRLDRGADTIGSLASLLVPTLPIFSQYQIGPLSIGAIIFIILGTFSFIESYRTKQRINIELSYLLLLCYVATIGFFVVIRRDVFGNSFVIGLMNILVFLYASSSICNRINLDKIYKSYNFLALFTCLVAIYQSIVVYMFKQPVSPVLLFPLQDSANWSFNSMRPMAFFQEPQALASWLIPYIFLSMYRTYHVRALMAAACVVLCGSTFGIISLVLVGLFAIILNGKIKIKYLVWTALCCVALYVMLSSPLLSSSAEKLTRVLDGISGEALLGISDYSRMFKAFDTYMELDPLGKITGIGYGTISSLINSGNLHFTWQSLSGMSQSQYQFMSTLFGVFVVYGLIGGILFWIPFLRGMFARGAVQKFFACFVIVTASSSSLLFNGNFLFLYLLYLADQPNNLNLEGEYCG